LTRPGLLSPCYNKNPVDNLTVIFIAFGLSVDAFAVSVTSGLVIEGLKARHAALIALFFGGFQAMMPILGWIGGTGFRRYISEFDHWVAFGLLALVGAKMVYEGARGGSNGGNKYDPLKLRVLFVLAVATSIDALAVGLGLSLLDVPILRPALIIGLVTFGVSFAGVYIGDRVGHLFERKVEVLGGLILIGIGVKILIEHI